MVGVRLLGYVLGLGCRLVFGLCVRVGCLDRYSCRAMRLAMFAACWVMFQGCVLGWACGIRVMCWGYVLGYV